MSVLTGLLINIAGRSVLWVAMVCSIDRIQVCGAVC